MIREKHVLEVAFFWPTSAPWLYQAENRKERAGARGVILIDVTDDHVVKRKKTSSLQAVRYVGKILAVAPTHLDP
jgi:hypothetical protein